MTATNEKKTYSELSETSKIQACNNVKNSTLFLAEVISRISKNVPLCIFMKCAVPEKCFKGNVMVASNERKGKGLFYSRVSLDGKIEESAHIEIAVRDILRNAKFCKIIPSDVQRISFRYVDEIYRVDIDYFANAPEDEEILNSFREQAERWANMLGHVAQAFAREKMQECFSGSFIEKYLAKQSWLFDANGNISM